MPHPGCCLLAFPAECYTPAGEPLRLTTPWGMGKSLALFWNFLIKTNFFIISDARMQRDALQGPVIFFPALGQVSEGRGSQQYIPCAEKNRHPRNSGPPHHSVGPSAAHNYRVKIHAGSPRDQAEPCVPALHHRKATHY